MPRKLVWIESQKFVGFGCSECLWVFKSTSPFVGRSLDRMKQAYKAEIDGAFAAHLCAEFPRIDGKKRDAPSH
jgi:hypothetical protein